MCSGCVDTVTEDLLRSERWVWLVKGGHTSLLIDADSSPWLSLRFKKSTSNHHDIGLDFDYGCYLLYDHMIVVIFLIRWVCAYMWSNYFYIYTRCFFLLFRSALKMTKYQPLQEISVLFLPKNDERRKLKNPTCYYYTVGTVEIL